MIGVRSPLRSPELRRIIAAYTVNRLGTWFGYVALSLAVFEHTHSALAVAALLVAGQALPAVLVPAVVARIEASPRRGELTALYIFEGVTTVALAVLLWNFWLPAVLVLVAIDGTAALAASALLRSEAARAAREHSLATAAGDETQDQRLENVRTAERKANAALNIAFSTTFVAGPGLAGLIVAGAGAPVALLIDAASFLIGGAMLIDLSPHVDEAAGTGVRARLRAAREHIKEVPALRMLLLVEGVALIFFAADASIEVPYAKATLHAGDSGYGLLLTVWGVGVAAGGLAFARAVRRSLSAMLIAGTLAVGVAYIGFAAAPTLLLACVAGFVGGAGNGVQWASLLSAVQQLTPPSLLGRMMGAVEAINALCPGIGLLLGGALVAIGSPRSAFLIVGVGAAAMTVAFVRLVGGAGLEPVGDSADTGPVLDSALPLMREPTRAEP